MQLNAQYHHYCHPHGSSHDPEFWKQVPPNEPYRVILGDVRDKLYQTRERARQLLSQGLSDIPEEAVFTNVEEVCLTFCFSLLILMSHRQ